MKNTPNTTIDIKTFFDREAVDTIQGGVEFCGTIDLLYDNAFIWGPLNEERTWNEETRFQIINLTKLVKGLMKILEQSRHLFLSKNTTIPRDHAEEIHALFDRYIFNKRSYLNLLEEMCFITTLEMPSYKPNDHWNYKWLADIKRDYVFIKKLLAGYCPPTKQNV